MHEERGNCLPTTFSYPLKAGLTALILVMYCIVSIPAASQTYDVAGDYTLTSNPSGAWSYGYSTSLESPFTLYTVSGKIEAKDGDNSVSLDSWQNGSDPNLGIFKNATGHEINGNTNYADGELALHPGQNGQYCKIIWTAPADGWYQLTARFRLNASGQTDVHLFIKGNEAVSTVLTAKSAMSSCNSPPVRFAAGDTIVFAVGDGGNGYAFDTTGLAARIRTLPADAGKKKDGLPAATASPAVHSAPKPAAHPASRGALPIRHPAPKPATRAIVHRSKPASKPKPATTVNRIHSKKVAPKP